MTIENCYIAGSASRILIGDAINVTITDCVVYDENANCLPRTVSTDRDPTPLHQSQCASQKIDSAISVSEHS